MKVFCGTDIIEVKRMEESAENLGPKFLARIFTENEIKYCEQKKMVKYQHYAARFAAKEAVFKAISSFLNDKYQIDWKNIEILNDKKGKPIVNFIGISFKQIESIDLSISHLKEYATANCVILCK
ncbi:MAG: holo-ACP synthase [Clostridia bacterium]